MEKITRKEAIQRFGLLGLSPLLTRYPAPNQPAKKPNIVLILCDQFRADACRREGFKLDTTPFLDSMAQSGTWFNKSYCAFPACGPSRTAMFSGRFPTATRVRSNWNIDDATYSKSLIDVLRAEGYKTAVIGKTEHSFLKLHRDEFDYFETYSHLGEKIPSDDQERAFNTYLHNTHFYVNLKPAPFPPEMQQPYRIVSDGMKWVESISDKGDPFFLYLSIPEPHNPYQVPEPYYSLFPPDRLPPLPAGDESLGVKGTKYQLLHQLENLGYGDYEKNIPRIRSNYYGMLRLIDDQVKRFVGFLRQHQLYENTIFIFVSDHGDYTGQYGLIKKGAGVPECLTRIPMFWHGPGIVSKRQPHPAHVSNVDLMPTLCEALGHPIPEGVMGRSLWPLLSGGDYPKGEFASIIVQQGFGGRDYTRLDQTDPYKEGCIAKGETRCDELNSYTQSGILRMLRKDDWKLEYNMQGNGRMFRLSSDPGEVHDLYGEKAYESKKLELLQDMLAWELRTQDPLPLPRTRYTYRGDKRNYWSTYSDPAAM